MEPTDFMAAEREDSHHMPRPALIPERSAASIMEESQEASLLAGARASVAVSTAAALGAVSTAVEAGEGNFGSTKTNEIEDTEKEHAHK
jgi:hypothetical protein